MKTMASDKEHFRYWILFALQLEKYAAEATEMIYSALGEGTVTHKTWKVVPEITQWEFWPFGPVIQKISKIRSWSNSWGKILLKRKKKF